MPDYRNSGFEGEHDYEAYVLESHLVCLFVETLFRNKTSLFVENAFSQGCCHRLISVQMSESGAINMILSQAKCSLSASRQTVLIPN